MAIRKQNNFFGDLQFIFLSNMLILRAIRIINPLSVAYLSHVTFNVLLQKKQQIPKLNNNTGILK